jgi:hypothetical protein
MRGGKREGSGRPAGAKNKRTAAIEAAAQAVAVRFKAEVPMAFDGDGVAFLQVVYRDPGQPIELRLDAAKAAARFERPALNAAVVKNISPAAMTGEERMKAIKQLAQEIGFGDAFTIDGDAIETDAGATG